MTSFCDETDLNDKRTLGTSAQEFLDHLRLPMTHPLCSGDTHYDVVSGDGNASAGGGEADNGELIDLLSRIRTGSVFELPSKQINGFDFDSGTLDTDVDTNINRNGRGHNAITSKQLNSQSLQESHQILLQKQPASPIIGPISLLELHDHSIPEVLMTAMTMSAPTLALMELWLRFFAVFLCPLCLCYMVQWEIKLASTLSSTRDNEATPTSTMGMAIYIVGLASSAVLLTDSLYVYEYGRWFGFTLFVISSVMAVRCATTTAALLDENQAMRNGEYYHEQKKKRIGRKSRSLLTCRKVFLFRCIIAFLIASTSVVFLRSNGRNDMEVAIQRFVPRSSTSNPTENDWIPKDPGIDLPTINEGLYHSSSNPLITSIVSHWPESSRTYNVANGATSYLVNGDQRTGIPFLVNKVEEQEYVRVWAHNKFDEEYMALDIAFPYADHGEISRDERQLFAHDVTNPVYLILHGLNGGSHEEYVKDLVKRRRSEGSTVIVLIARGMMDTKLVGWNAFHGARTGDVDAASRAIRSGLISLAEAHHIKPNQRQILAGVGYSMGERLYFGVCVLFRT